jgi:predicted CXXCH cytochrome family protein
VVRPAALALLLLSACPRKDVREPAAPAVAATRATLFVTADLRGYLGPCGCSENMRGGVPRAAWQVAEARKDGRPVLVIDAGDTLFPHLSLPAAAVPEEERKAKALAEAFKLMGLSVHAAGELDDARGPDFRRSLGLPELEGDAVKLLDAGGRKVAVVSARTLETAAALSKQAREQRADFVLVLLHQPLEQAQKLPKESGADLVIAGHARDELSADDNKVVRGEVPAAQLQSKGRSILRIDLELGGPAGARFELVRGAADLDRELAAYDERIEQLRKQVNEPSLSAEMIKLRKAKLEETIARREQAAARPVELPKGKNAFALRPVPLESSFESLPEAKAIVTAYDRDVGKLNLAWAKEHGADCPAPPRGEPSFVGNETCRDCHEEAFAVWDKSKHAHAYATLEEVGKNFHLQCVGCHVTGWQKPGGVCRIDKVDERKDVGCESCHGPGSIHSEDPSNDNVIRKNEPKHCVGCHDVENSPHFEFQRYLAEILGPGHGQPLPGGKKSAPRKR